MVVFPQPEGAEKINTPFISLYLVNLLWIKSSRVVNAKELDAHFLFRFISSMTSFDNSHEVRELRRLIKSVYSFRFPENKSLININFSLTPIAVLKSERVWFSNCSAIEVGFSENKSNVEVSLLLFGSESLIILL